MFKSIIHMDTLHREKNRLFFSVKQDLHLKGDTRKLTVTEGSSLGAVDSGVLKVSKSGDVDPS